MILLVMYSTLGTRRDDFICGFHVNFLEFYCQPLIPPHILHSNRVYVYSGHISMFYINFRGSKTIFPRLGQDYPEISLFGSCRV